MKCEQNEINFKITFFADLFTPLFDVIARQTKAPTYSGLFDKKLDTDYRILSDHSRMLSVCLSDGMFPESSPKLKQVLKRALRVARHSFLKSSGRIFIFPDF